MCCTGIHDLTLYNNWFGDCFPQKSNSKCCWWLMEQTSQSSRESCMNSCKREMKWYVWVVLITVCLNEPSISQKRPIPYRWRWDDRSRSKLGVSWTGALRSVSSTCMACRNIAWSLIEEYFSDSPQSSSICSCRCRKMWPIRVAFSRV